MTVKALVLDMDGVLVPPLRFAEYLKREYPSIREQMPEFFRGVFGECILGRADLRDVLPPYLAKWEWPHSLDDFMTRWFEEESELDARLIDTVRAVRASGVPCYVATNQERHRIRYMRSQMQFDEHFDDVFASADIGYKKPDAEFYDAVTERLGVPGEAVLFWDDTQANVDAARACGWQAQLYTGYDVFVREVSRVLGIGGSHASS